MVDDFNVDNVVVSGGVSFFDGLRSEVKSFTAPLVGKLNPQALGVVEDIILQAYISGVVHGVKVTHLGCTDACNAILAELQVGTSDGVEVKE